MAHSNPENTRPSRADTRKIPTLTDVVQRPEPQRSTDAAASSRSDELKTNGGIPRKTLERLIYKKLHQRLPRLAQELAGDILKEMQDGRQSRKPQD